MRFLRYICSSIETFTSPSPGLLRYKCQHSVPAGATLIQQVMNQVEDHEDDSMNEDHLMAFAAGDLTRSSDVLNRDLWEIGEE
jgi:hypothetical protein